MTAETGTYPLTFGVEYPARLSRWLIFVKWLLAIPHLVILGALSYVVQAITFIAWFAILFTGRYPRGLFDFVVNVYRWQANLYAYVLLFRDEYPPFSWERGLYPVTFEVEYPERLSRLLIFLKWWLLAIPHYILLFLLSIVAFLAWVITWFAILITARFPKGLFDFLAGVIRWGYRVNGYAFLLLRDEYPPFSLK